MGWFWRQHVYDVTTTRSALGRGQSRSYGYDSRFYLVSHRPRNGHIPNVPVARLLVSVKRPDGFIDLAERGAFVYDWTDGVREAHQCEQKQLHAGEVERDAQVQRFEQLQGLTFHSQNGRRAL